MFAFAVIFQSMLNWPFAVSICLAGSVVLLFVFWGGLSSSIYNECIQFFLIIAGFLPLTFIGLHAVGGWHSLLRKAARLDTSIPGQVLADPAIRWACPGG